MVAQGCGGRGSVDQGVNVVEAFDRGSIPKGGGDLRTHCHVNIVLEEQLIHAIRRRALPGWVEELAHISPVLVDLLCEAHDRPAYDLEMAIRAVLREHTRVTCDPAIFDPHAMEHHVRLLVDLLDDLRRQQMRRGEWSEVAPPPQMFG
jgi:hypothetical protein